ncbi:hypothetical protein BC827DRAFT_1145318 [Russula dissimulans]|nr:hypothetical protein BC827DRAFT_1145318 [Russula dissimulans]
MSFPAPPHLLSSPLKRRRCPSKRTKGSPGILASHRIFVLQTKLSHEDISEIFDLADKADADVVSSPDEADIVITAIGMRKRLERHLDWNLAVKKSLVTPDWLRGSVAQGRPLPCTDYAAIPELKEATEKTCSRSRYPSPKSASRSPTPHNNPPPRPSSPRPARADVAPPAFLLHPSVAPPLVKLDHTARFCCFRASPLICANQPLCSALDVLRRSRALESNDRSALAYARAIAVSPAFPRKITTRERGEVQNLPYIGTKIAKMIDEYLFHGHIPEVEQVRQSERFISLSLFSSVYGIGPVTARNLYDRGLRSLRDLEAYYEVDAGFVPRRHEHPHCTRIARRSQSYVRNPLSKGSWRDAVLTPTQHPSPEVEAIHATIMSHLDAVQPGCVGTLVGGYRRGKPASNDIDIVFTHPNAKSTKDLCARLVERLRSVGLVTHVMHLSSFHEHNALRTSHWDSLEKALTVYRSPSDGRYRRVDLISALPETYWTAVVGWTGGTMFERDLRSAAKAIGLKFDSSGITRRHDSKLIYPRSEKEVFDIIGLPWVDPTLRNTDA